MPFFRAFDGDQLWRYEGGGELRILPTPAAGLRLTSTVASSGISSRRRTSMGPLTAPMMQYPLCV